MSQHTIWVLGWVALAPAAIVAAVSIWRSVAPQWRRILSLACGNRELPPVPTAASVAFPHRPRRHQLRASEAGVELTQASDA